MVQWDGGVLLPKMFNLHLVIIEPTHRSRWRDIPLSDWPVLSTKDNIKKHKTTKGGRHSTLKETKEPVSPRATCLLDQSLHED